MALDKVADSKGKVHRGIGPVSPICCIPSEVALEIFKFCLPDDIFPRPSVRSAPLLLSRVCHTWRILAITTPRLWCKLLLETRSFKGPDEISEFVHASELDTMALKVWMERAAALRMSVHFRYKNFTLLPGGDIHIVNKEYAPQIFQVIVDNPTRWKELRLSTPTTYLGWVSRLVQKYTLNLETLQMHDGTWDYPRASTSRIYFEATTTKTLLALAIRAVMWGVPPTHTSFEQLCRLSVKHAHAWNCLELLKYCPVLEYLTLHFYNRQISDPFNPPPPTITTLLPRLQYFRLTHTRFTSIHSSGEIGELLDQFNFHDCATFICGRLSRDQPDPLTPTFRGTTFPDSSPVPIVR